MTTGGRYVTRRDERTDSRAPGEGPARQHRPELVSHGTAAVLDEQPGPTAADLALAAGYPLRRRADRPPAVPGFHAQSCAVTRRKNDAEYVPTYFWDTQTAGGSRRSCHGVSPAGGVVSLLGAEVLWVPGRGSRQACSRRTAAIVASCCIARSRRRSV